MSGIGVDIVEIERMREILERTPRFKERVFSEAERAWAQARPNRAGAYAGFFAAREATLKALGIGFGAGVGFCDVSVIHDDRGRPQVVLKGKAREIASQQGIERVYISISRTRSLAVANAFAVCENEMLKQPDNSLEETVVIAEEFRRARSLLEDLDTNEEV